MLNQFLLIVQTLLSVAFPIALIYAALSDLRRLEISNWVSIVIALAFLPAALLAGLSPGGMVLHYAVGVALFAAGGLLFWRGLFGGGDVKLLAASGIWFQWDDLGLFLVVVALFGGLLALFILAAKKFIMASKALGNLPWLHGNGGLKQPIPYGIAIAAAALTLWFRLPVLPPFVTNALNG